MSNSKLGFSVFFFLVFCIFPSSCLNSNNTIHTYKCSPQQTQALLHFKQNLSSINDTSYDLLLNPHCQDWLGSGYYPIMINSWNTSTDCCDWNGVTCDDFTGDVIGLDLSCGKIQGTIHPNTSLFNLPHLQTLNLAYNDFSFSQLPSEIGRFSDTLTHLNISHCRFSGQVPSDITRLHKLVSLDLSSNYGHDLSLEPHVFNTLLQNSTLLRHLSLADVNISSVLPTYLNISSSLVSLDLGFTNLRGKLPDNIFNLQYLEIIDLSGNKNLTGPLPNVNTSTNIPLKHLDLSFCGFSGQVPTGITHLHKLVSLDLSQNFDLKFEPHVFNTLLKNSTLLRDLSLIGVNIRSVLPTYLNLSSSLVSLDLRYTNLRGKLPDNIFNLQYLEKLYLSGNENLTGPLPDVNTSTNTPLKELDLSRCSLVGSIPKSIVNLRQLTSIDLSFNYKLNGTLPSGLFTLPSLEYLYLYGNMFNGNVSFQSVDLLPLKVLDLTMNQFDGQIDQGSVLQTYRQLTWLDLSFNNFRGEWELDTLLSTLKNLYLLDLSYSGLSLTTNNANHYVNPDFQYLKLASCKLKVFPESLRAMRNLEFLDLSGNEIHGSIPFWAGNIEGNKLTYLNLSHNFITGIPQFQWYGLQELYLQSNLIEGPFPPSICNMNGLGYLDMSNNRFGGVIPQCVGNISSSVTMVNLGNNSFHGTIPNAFEECGDLDGLILNGNELDGEVPTSLSRCQYLRVVDLGNNHLNGTFPHWLGGLSELQVLVLKSNHLHGSIEASSMVKFPFQNLQVLDLSNNSFTGHLPQKYFQNFNAMKKVVNKHTKVDYLNVYGFYYSIVANEKGSELEIPRIFVDLKIVDLSNNKFEGEIPEIIGNLTSLIVLELSNNRLTGRIPDALGKLSEIESLDLSSNQLTGEIPQSLADLTSLGFLNLSQNHLVGSIPQGTQLTTFSTSFEGNPGLCGLPLPKECEHQSSPPVEAHGDDDDDDDDDGFTWKVVMMGYGSGTVIGLVLGYFMLSTGKPKWFSAIGDEIESMIFKRRRRYIYTRR